MATNTYFNNKVVSEQMLYEDLIVEALQIYGQDVIYIPRTLTNYDNLMGESIAADFADGYNIEMYLDNAEGFGGEGDLFSKFGVEIRDQATLIVSKLRWEKLTGYSNNLINNERPSEGDLIYLPLSNSLFEIAHVEHEQPFYQLAQWPTYKLQIEKFEYAGENLKTGYDEIDKLDDDFAFAYKLLVDGSNGTSFTVHETVTQTLGTGVVITAEVAQFEAGTLPANRYLYLSHVRSSSNKYTEFALALPVVGMASAASWNVVSVSEDQGDPFNKNDTFDTLRTDILDFNETNPFGEI